MALENLSNTLHSLEIKLKQLQELETALIPLQEIDGYLASAVFDSAGKLLVKHNRSKYNFEMSGANVAEIISNSVKTTNSANLGQFHFIQVNAERGVFCAVWAAENQSIAVVLLESKGNVGLAKLALTKLRANILA
jgi:predicted regulator of Ras-like GTPase activity (Roadblock/LC7/MglB family)